MQRILFLLLVVTAVFALTSPAPVHGQEPTPVPTETPTPTITPTPASLRGVPLSGGGEMLIEKRVSYGDIAVVIAVLALLAFQVVHAFVRVPLDSLKRG